MQKKNWILALSIVYTALACGGLPKIKSDGSGSSLGGQFNVANTGGQGFVLGDGGSGGADEDAGDCSGTSCHTGPVCGNSIIEESESCDDGNTTPGDGCNGVCHIDPGYVCPTPGQKCVLTVSCGDGKISGSEACDDTNTVAGDGCSADCLTVENGYSCPTPGQLCVKATSQPVCKNGIVEAGETCDDGNTSPGDGCSATCQIEAGYTCPKPGAKCNLIQYCGDGVLNGAEQCDDGNLKPGDCCDGNCHLEPNCSCITPSPALNPPKQVCSSSMVCGDGERTGTEACDDKNTVAGDGCSADCTYVEPGYSCPSSGGACKLAATAACGNATLETGEYCDDGNTSSNDGCSADCKVESGFVCPKAGQRCVVIPRCGDSNIDYQRSETCDDGNLTPGDGCAANCTIELGWSCTPVATGTQAYKSVCANATTCGDKKITGAETCDDGNSKANDGCSSTCQLEAGWVCPVIGGACRAAECGDGIIAGNEECDDSNTKAGDGCSDTCRVEPGWLCPDGKTCRATVCGDHNKEGSEQCDDGNLIPYDGCSPTCTIDPTCENGACTAFCGDGFKFDQEECDDGNTRSGDGCSADCKTENGWSCPTTTQAPPDALNVPVLIRDMMYYDTVELPGVHPAGHPDFQRTEYTPNNTACRTNSVTSNLVKTQLGSDGKPVFNASIGTDITCRTAITDATSFGSWYHDDPLNAVVPSNLTLNHDAASGCYVFDSASDEPYKTRGGFFPINNLGWQTPAICALCQVTTPDPWCKQCPGNSISEFANTTRAGRNYSFTSEVRFQFTFKGDGTENLTFRGDDDVWVFVNGKLAVDIGGIHSATQGAVTLTADTSYNPPQNVQFGLAQGGMYEIAVFQAERNVTESNYRLMLCGFVHKISTCTPDCGDGIVTGTEACDLGKDKNSGAYGGCTDKCTLGPYCGDQTVQSPQEQCDDGNNTTLYDKTKKACGPGCLLPHYCGDAVVDSAYGEICDAGANNVSAGTYGSSLCTIDCTPAAYCGDGTKNGPEQCDDGVNNGTPSSTCDTTCLLKCGNGVLDVGEQCDLGTAKNIGGYDGCNANCTKGPYCGDGVRQDSEQCDDGKNDGSYGTCGKGCVLAGYCGDGTLQNPPESCDQGAANSVLSYGSGLCTNQCAPAPYCGDKSVDSQFGEKCDDGVNSGAPGSCKPDCSGWVPLNTCGNGTVDSGEQCDEGTNNGNVLSNCDAHCRIKCGNGIVDVGEQCDDGVNDGSYGGCTPTCQFAGYCGDGTVNGSEQCDLGAANEASPYGKGKCTKACQNAPYCGDGRVQPPEVCDGQDNCTITCTWWTPLYY